MAAKSKHKPITRDAQSQSEGTSSELDRALAEVDRGAGESFASFDDWARALDYETS